MIIGQLESDEDDDQNEEDWCTLRRLILSPVSFVQHLWSRMTSTKNTHEDNAFDAKEEGQECEVVHVSIGELVGLNTLLAACQLDRLPTEYVFL